MRLTASGDDRIISLRLGLDLDLRSGSARNADGRSWRAFTGWVWCKLIEGRFNQTEKTRPYPLSEDKNVSPLFSRECLRARYGTLDPFLRRSGLQKSSGFYSWRRQTEYWRGVGSRGQT